MAFIYALKVDGDGATTSSYSDWIEDYKGATHSGEAPSLYPGTNWNLDLARPDSNKDQDGGITIGDGVTDFDGTVYDGISAPINDVNGDGNLDAGDTFQIWINYGDDVIPDWQLETGTVDYYFTPNANPDTSLMVFTLTNSDTGDLEKYAYNVGNGVDGEVDPHRIPGGRITEGQTNNGKTFENYEDRVFVCFARGTLIDTPDGKVAIENLVIGDHVTTLSSGAQAVRWTGSTKRLCRGSLVPIRIKAGALGENTPSQDLIVSPAHRIIVSGWRAEMLFGEPEVLVPAKSLVNDNTIAVARDLETIEYFHIMFDKHEIVMSNGAASESFHPSHDAIGALDSEAREELFELFPELENAGTNAFTNAVRPMLTDAEASLLR